jgi:hypothetical protein
VCAFISCGLCALPGEPYPAPPDPIVLVDSTCAAPGCTGSRTGGGMGRRPTTRSGQSVGGGPGVPGCFRSESARGYPVQSVQQIAEPLHTDRAVRGEDLHLAQRGGPNSRATKRHLEPTSLDSGKFDCLEGMINYLHEALLVKSLVANLGCLQGFDEPHRESRLAKCKMKLGRPPSGGL